MNAHKQLLSIIVPVLDEEDNVRQFYNTLAPVVQGMDLDYEIIYVDDGSTDATHDLITQLSEQDQNVKCLRFSRNFGSHAAMLAGLRHCKGDAAVIISVDLQDPPELIKDMVDIWREGKKVVWAVRESRDDPFSKKLLANAFYQVFSRIGLKNYPRTGMDFGLYDRQVIDNMNRLRESNHFVPGLILWLGFPQGYVYYHRRNRERGISKWPLNKRIKNALDAICSFSHVPIRFISWTGIVISLISFVFAITLLFRKMILGLGTLGWPSVMVAILFLGGVQLIMLGVLGEYIWRGTDEARKRPQFIIMDTIGMDISDEQLPR